jgi:hypothetical protein
MKKLAFLVGQWQEDASITRGPGGPIQVRQTEQVQFKLDSLVLLIEGTGRDAKTGEVAFNALATVSFDEATKTYRLRAHNDGRYLETELIVADRGFEWGYTAGLAKVSNRMTIDESGRWIEHTDVVNNGSPQRLLEMRLSRGQ